MEIGAPAEALYAAFAEPASLMEWLPPGTMTGRALEYDFREGGRYRIALTYDEATPAGAGKRGANRRERRAVFQTRAGTYDR